MRARSAPRTDKKRGSCGQEPKPLRTRAEGEERSSKKEEKSGKTVRRTQFLPTFAKNQKNNELKAESVPHDTNETLLAAGRRHLPVPLPIPGADAVPHQRRAARGGGRPLHAATRQLDAAHQQRGGHGLQAALLPLVHRRRVHRGGRSERIHRALSFGLLAGRHGAGGLSSSSPSTSSTSGANAGCGASPGRASCA